jgi:Pentapeptide repeats (8 copies)
MNRAARYGLYALALVGLVALALWLLSLSWWVPIARITLVLAMLAVIGAGVLWLPAWLVNRDTAGISGGDEFEERTNAINGARTAVVQGIVGLLALAGVFVAWQQLRNDREQLLDDQKLARMDLQQVSTQLRLTRQAQVAERFTNAVEQLGSGNRERQLGGIYALERIARESDSNRLQVYEVLTGYVRLHARQNDADPDEYAGLASLEDRAPDVQAAITVLGRRTVKPSDPPLNLRKVDLRKSDLQRAKLQHVRLDGAWLQGANLNWAVLERTRLLRARLHGTYFKSAKQLELAELQDAHSSANTTWPDRFNKGAAGVVEEG